MITLLENHLEASFVFVLVFVLLFLASMSGLLFFMVWIEQLGAESWRPSWLDRRRLARVSVAVPRQGVASQTTREPPSVS
ncbi:MAG: hypothetical protein ACRDPI_02930 [Nocardioidaceae bacterium]